MHSTPGMSNWKKWKCLVNNDEISYEKVVLKLLLQSQFTVADELMSLDHFSLMRIFNFLDIF